MTQWYSLESSEDRYLILHLLSHVHMPLGNFLCPYLLLLEDISVLPKAQLAEELWQVGAFQGGVEVTAITARH